MKKDFYSSALKRDSVTLEASKRTARCINAEHYVSTTCGCYIQ